MNYLVLFYNQFTVKVILNLYHINILKFVYMKNDHNYLNHNFIQSDQDHIFNNYNYILNMYSNLIYNYI